MQRRELQKRMAAIDLLAAMVLLLLLAACGAGGARPAGTDVSRSPSPSDPSGAGPGTSTGDADGEAGAPGDAQPAASAGGPGAGTAGLNSSPRLAVYWGQNGIGNSAPGDPARWEPPLTTLCARPEYDIVLLAFVTRFESARNADGYPELDFANHCTTPYDARNPWLLRCPDIEEGIRACQAAGKRVLLSLGGAAGAYGFTSDAQAERFADTVWAMFLGGGGAVRPFGAAVLDGVDLDIEGGSPTGYGAFVRALRQRMAGDASRPYLVTAAPQCPWPDAYLGPGLGAALADPTLFDALLVQFYNNACSYRDPAAFRDAFASWARLAVAGGPTILVGLPASEQAGAGYVDRNALGGLVASLRGDPAFGGLMLWDASFDQGGSEAGPTYGELAAGLLAAPP